MAKRKKKKAGNGCGTCYKVGPNKWIARATIGWQEIEKDGKIYKKQIKKTIDFFKTESEGRKALALFEYNKGSEMTLEQLYTDWKKSHFQNISETYRKNVESKWNSHISKLKDYQIKDLKTNILQEFYNNLPLSKTSADTVKSVFSLILNHAEKNDYIGKNYMNFVESRKPKTKSIRRVFTDEEIEKLWSLRGNACATALIIMIYTGLRIGELLNLRLEDINLEERFLTVTESKTLAGTNRIVPIAKRLIPVILKPHGKEYFFEGKTGNKKQYTTFWREFNNLMKELNFDHTIHDCRHTFASRMSTASANTVSIAKIIGHADYKTTANIYTMKSTKELINEIDKLN